MQTLPVRRRGQALNVLWHGNSAAYKLWQPVIDETACMPAACCSLVWRTLHKNPLAENPGGCCMCCSWCHSGCGVLGNCLAGAMHSTCQWFRQSSGTVVLQCAHACHMYLQACMHVCMPSMVYGEQGGFLLYSRQYLLQCPHENVCLVEDPHAV